MNCRFCNRQLDEDSLLCPSCGGLNTAPVYDDESEYDEENVEFTETEAVCLEEETVCEQTELSKAKPKRKWWMIALAVFCSAALLFTLTALVLLSQGTNLFAQIGDLFKGRENNVLYKDIYSADADKAVKNADIVVASVGDQKLTNGLLQLYYTDQILDYLQYYSSSLSYLGLDYTKPLSEQTCYFDAEQTWEQYFLDMSIKTWQNYALMNILAEEAGISFDPEELETVTEIWNQMAQQYGYASGEELVHLNYGSNVSIKAYLDFQNTMRLAEDYSALKYEEFLPTMEQMEAYYAAHESEFRSGGITKDSGPIVDVRHLLVMPKGGTKAEDGVTVTYSEEEWAACLQEAEALYAQWKAGDATQESFAALATEHTEDPGSASTGGLYQEITASSNLVPEFLEWCIAAERKSGDTDIIKTDYGYHIMYFVDGEEQWIVACETNYVADQITKMLEEAKERLPMTVSYKKIVLASDGLIS